MRKLEAWQCYPALTEFESYAGSWGVLNNRLLQTHPLGDSSFVGPLIKCFANSQDFLAVQPIGNEYQGMLLLRMGRFGVVSSFRPAQTEICPVLINSVGMCNHSSQHYQSPHWPCNCFAKIRITVLLPQHPHLPL